MPDPLLLFSVNTLLAYMISECFYGQRHYVWCSPCFDSRSRFNTVDCTNPPTSNPAEIYHNLYEETRRGDRHSAKIDENRSGILRGADCNKSVGIITGEQEQRILSIVNSAGVQDFKPLLYIIPFHRVADLLKDVPVTDLAHPLSFEYKIERLPRDNFDVVELERT